MLVDEAAQELAGGRLLRQIVPNQFESATFQVGDRLAAAGSAGFEIDLEWLAHFFLTHHASGFAAAGLGAAAVAYFGASSSSIA